MAESNDVFGELTKFSTLWNQLKARASSTAKACQDYEDMLWQDYIQRGKRPPEAMVQKLYKLRSDRDLAQQEANEAPGEFVRSYGAFHQRSKARDAAPRLSR